MKPPIRRFFYSMNYVPKEHQELLNLYKGVNPELLADLPKNEQAYLASKAIKELSLLAESGSMSAGQKLQDSINTNHHSYHLDIESLIEYGKTYDQLYPSQKNQVKRMEIQQEFGHFSRIMNLDGVVSGSHRTPMETTIDFSRFLELLIERRSERGSHSLSRWSRHYQSSGQQVTNSPACGIMETSAEDGLSALLGVKQAQPSFQPKNRLQEYAVLSNRFDHKQATLLFDYLLALNNCTADLAFVSTRAFNHRSTLKVEINGGGGCGVMVTIPDPENKYRELVVHRLTVGQANSWNFGAVTQTPITSTVTDVPGDTARIYSFHPSSWEKVKKSGLDDLNQLLNAPQKNGWVNPTNSLISFLKSHGVVSQITSVRTKGAVSPIKLAKPKNPYSKLISPLSAHKVFRELISAHHITLETGHIHADRRPGLEQWECLSYTKAFASLLKRRGYTGKINHVTMIDDYHVINNFDYQKYASQIKARGISISEVILESSPLVRLIAIDVLKYLYLQAEHAKSYKIEERGGNIYLHIPQTDMVIELVADHATNPTIGCVLYDVALCLYKSLPEFYKTRYNSVLGLTPQQNIHRILVQYYNQHLSLEQRRAFLESYFLPIPTLVDLRQTTKKPAIPKSHSTHLINVLAHFYQPQQKKVNQFLKILGQPPLVSLFYNSESNSVTLKNN